METGKLPLETHYACREIAAERDQLRAENDSLRAKAEGLKADADRYRWVEKHLMDASAMLKLTALLLDGYTVSEAIDALRCEGE